jgi:adenylyl-sulfate kinase
MTTRTEMAPDDESELSRRHAREQLLGQRGGVVWLTGLSAAGKSTLSRGLERQLTQAGRVCYVLDGDIIRNGLCSDLGFSPEDRKENIRRIGQVAALFADAGIVVIAAFISPYRADREAARRAVGAERFLEVYLDVALAECEARDTKDLYRRARAGELRYVTGVDAPYERPEAPDIALPTATASISECVMRLYQAIQERGWI